MIIRKKGRPWDIPDQKSMYSKYSSLVLPGSKRLGGGGDVSNFCGG